MAIAISTKNQISVNSKSPRSRWKIYLVENQANSDLGTIVRSEADFSVCGAAGSIEQALPGISHSKPHLVLVDLSLPGIRGLKLSVRLIKEIRRVSRNLKLLVLAAHNQAAHAAKILRAGADGYIL